MTVQSKRRIGIAVFAITLLFVFIVLHLDRLNEWLGSLLFILRPVLIGLVLAYLCNPIFRLFERRLLARISSHGFRRTLSLLCTYAVLFLIFFLLVILIVPQLFASIQDFLDNYEGYIESAVKSINGLIGSMNDTFSVSIPHLNAADIQNGIGNFFERLELQQFLDSQLTFSNLTLLFEALTGLISLVADILFGIFISLYILHSKERIYAQLTRWRHALFNPITNGYLTNILSTADKSFGGFLRGKLLDSSIVGVLVFTLISILRIPYPLLIAVIIGITDIVPIIGPFVGVIPSAVIILLTDPIKVIPFLLCILVVQQIDGNIIAPKILGENTGVSSLCVMISITVLGAIWGFVGMVVAVPLAATLLTLVSRSLEKSLQKKGLPVDTQSYYGTQNNAKAVSSQRQESRRKSKNTQAPATQHVGGGNLTDTEHRHLRAYALAKKHGLLTASTPEAFEAFAAELTPTEQPAAAAEEPAASEA